MQRREASCTCNAGQTSAVHQQGLPSIRRFPLPGRGHRMPSFRPGPRLRDRSRRRQHPCLEQLAHRHARREFFEKPAFCPLLGDADDDIRNSFLPPCKGPQEMTARDRQLSRKFVFVMPLDSVRP